MSDIVTQRRIRDLEAMVDRLKTMDQSGPIYLPWTQRILNPFPLASSNSALCDQPQPWPVNVLAFYCTVYVSTTNNGTNFWIIKLQDNVGNNLASFDTSAIAANTAVRFQVLSSSFIAQPSSTNTHMTVVASATLSPGSIYMFPAVALLRSG